MRINIEPKILYFGTPVVLISTLNEDNTPNLAPMSSAWSLGWFVTLGLGSEGKTYENLERTKECVLNFPSGNIWEQVEKLGGLTGKNPVPYYNKEYTNYEKFKFETVNFTPITSDTVRPPAVKECKIQMEAKVSNIYNLEEEEDNNVKIVIVKVVKVFASPDIVLSKNHINPKTWTPLIYNFRHYFILGKELGKSEISET